MKRTIYLLILLSFLAPAKTFAQLEKVILETYYISDANDSTDTLGGHLEPGSITYRIYIDLQSGYKLLKLYGDADHTLRIASTTNFFNNVQDGVSFGKDMPKIRLSEGTVALDTWLTLGQATTKKNGITNFGVLKANDRNGSFIGGANNDGGSAGVPTGLLTNADPAAGIPLITKDGLDTMNTVPTGWLDYGIVSLSGDSTIFGSIVPCSEFVSNSAGIVFPSGVTGVNPDSNQILIAQLTTRGQLSFQLNIQVSDTGGNIINYLATGHDSDYASTNIKDRVSSFLKYPPECGCKDASYLEYNTNYGCHNPDSCKTLVVFGCMDTMACNYDPMANFNIINLCCYPGYCNDRNISFVCPAVASNNRMKLFPNPVQNQVTLEIQNPTSSSASYMIYNSFGRLVLEKDMTEVEGTMSQTIDVSNLTTGLYLFRLVHGALTEDKMFMKN